MSTQLDIDLTFFFEKHPIHAFSIRGQTAFLASEVGAVLGIADANRSLRESKIAEKPVDYDVVTPDALHETEPGSVSTGVSVASNRVTILFESGLYALVLRSDKPAAIRFTRWVIRDVLPELRRAGTFSLLPRHLQPEAISQAQVLKLVEFAGRGNPWAVSILRSLGLRPAEEGGAA